MFASVLTRKQKLNLNMLKIDPISRFDSEASRALNHSRYSLEKKSSSLIHQQREKKSVARTIKRRA
jgi:hypothetical protein